MLVFVMFGEVECPENAPRFYGVAGNSEGVDLSEPVGGVCLPDRPNLAGKLVQV